MHAVLLPISRLCLESCSKAKCRVLFVASKETPLRSVCLAGMLMPAFYSVNMMTTARDEAASISLEDALNTLKTKLQAALLDLEDLRRLMQEKITVELDLQLMSLVVQDSERAITCYVQAVKNRIVQEHTKAIDAVRRVAASDTWTTLNTYVEASEFPGESAQQIMAIVGSSEGADLYQACKAYDACEDNASAISKSFEAILQASPTMATCERIAQDLRLIGETFEQSEDTMKGLLQPLADMTVVQAGLRDLGMHESRSALARKCRKGLAKRRYMVPNAKLMMWLQAFEEQ